MKKITCFFVLLLLCSILCGCRAGIMGEASSFLSERERSEIESGILEGLEFTASKVNLNVSFRNTSEYTLRDVQLVRKGYSDAIVQVPYIESGSGVNMSIGTKQQIPSAGEVYVVYTVGKYTYQSELSVPIRIQNVEEVKKGEFTFTVYTDDGPVQSDMAEPLWFMTGEELQGLERTRIYSLAVDNSVESTTDITLSGSKPNDYYGSVIYKLYDPEGIIIESGRLYFFDDEETIYLTYGLSGDYTLVFEEKS